MALTEKELIAGVLKETLNLDDAGVAGLYNPDGSLKDDAKDTILELDSARVKNLKAGDGKGTFDDGYKKAQSEVAKKQEDAFKTKTGFKSDKIGIDLYLEYAAEQAKAKGEITEDVIKKNAVYLSMVEKKDAEIAAALADGETKLTGFQKELSKKENFSKAANKISEIFLSQKPALSKDPVKAKTQVEDFVERFKGYEFEFQGERIVVLKDGKAVENSSGNPIAFDKLVKDTTSKYFDLIAIDDKSSAGATTTGAGGKNTYEVPKTQEDFDKYISNSAIPLAERNAVAAEWGK